MIEERASVVCVEEDFAWIEAQRRSTCGRCNLNKGCGTAVLDKLFGRATVRVRALNPINAQIGEEVAVGIPEQGLVKGSIAVYAVPLIFMLSLALLGVVIPSSVFPQETISILLAVLGLILGFGWLAIFARRVSHHPHYNPVILRRTLQEQAHPFPDQDTK